MSAAMIVKTTMTISTRQTHLDFLLKERSTNEAKVIALSQSLVTLKEELADKEQALAEYSKQLRNAMEAIRIHSDKGHYCEMTMFTTQ